MTRDPVLPHDLDDLYGIGAEQADLQAEKKRVYALVTGGEILDVRLMDDQELETQKELAFDATSGECYWTLYKDPEQTAEIEHLRKMVDVATTKLAKVLERENP